MRGAPIPRLECSQDWEMPEPSHTIADSRMLISRSRSSSSLRSFSPMGRAARWWRSQRLLS